MAKREQNKKKYVLKSKCSQNTHTYIEMMQYIANQIASNAIFKSFSMRKICIVSNTQS